MIILFKSGSYWWLDAGVCNVKKYRTKKEALLYCLANGLDVSVLDKNGICRKVYHF